MFGNTTPLAFSRSSTVTLAPAPRAAKMKFSPTSSSRFDVASVCPLVLRRDDHHQLVGHERKRQQLGMVHVGADQSEVELVVQHLGSMFAVVDIASVISMAGVALRYAASTRGST